MDVSLDILLDRHAEHMWALKSTCTTLLADTISLCRIELIVLCCCQSQQLIYNVALNVKERDKMSSGESRDGFAGVEESSQWAGPERMGLSEPPAPMIAARNIPQHHERKLIRVR